MKKKLNKSFFENLENRKQIRTCDEKDCLEPGYFQAPKSPDGKGWYYFCSNHIKTYNKRWNFFAGKTKNKFTITKRMIFIRADQHHHLPTGRVQK